MKNIGTRTSVNGPDLATLPAKVLEEVRRTVDSAYEDVSRSMKRAKYAATDVIDDGRHKIKQRPYTVVGSAALAGLAIGFTIGWFAGSRTTHE